MIGVFVAALIVVLLSMLLVTGIAYYTANEVAPKRSWLAASEDDQNDSRVIHIPVRIYARHVPTEGDHPPCRRRHVSMSEDEKPPRRRKSPIKPQHEDSESERPSLKPPKIPGVAPR